MAEPSLKVVTDAHGDRQMAPPTQAEAILAQAAALDAAGRAAADRAGGRARASTWRRPLHLDRQRLCRRAESADHAGHFRQGRVLVREGQHVKAGDELFEIDPEPFRFALTQAQGKLDSVRTDFANLKSNYVADQARRAGAEERRAEAARRRAQDEALADPAGSQVDLDNAMAALVTAQLQAQFAAQQAPARSTSCWAIPICRSSNSRPISRPRRRWTRRSAISTTLCCGRRSPAPRPRSTASSSAASSWPARRCSPSSTTARPGSTPIRRKPTSPICGSARRSTIDIDSFPDRSFRGTVASVSPGTGAQFAILPPQNASGNWVKVVQRVPVRIAFDNDQDCALRSGMSVNVDIDTRHSRLPFGCQSRPPQTAAQNDRVPQTCRLQRGA